MQLATINHIEMRPSVMHGVKPCVAGTRIRVQDIYVWHEVQGQSPHQIVANFPQLSLADVHAALSFYWDNPTLIQGQIAAGEAEAERLRAQNPAKLATKIAAMNKDGDSVSS